MEVLEVQSAELDVSSGDRAVNDLVERLLGQTAGNAFFLGEMVSMLRERGLDEIATAAPAALGQVVESGHLRQLVEAAATSATGEHVDLFGCVG